MRRKKLTCMLLYLLKVLQQTGHENCVGPIRIWDGVGIQYWPLLSLLMGYPETSPSPSLSVISEEEESIEAISAALGLGRPICRATVTVSSSSPSSVAVLVLVLDEKKLSSLAFFFLSTSIALLQEECCCCWSSSCLVGLKLRRGRASLRGGDGGGVW